MAGRKKVKPRKVAARSYDNRLKDSYGPGNERDHELWTQEEKDALWEGFLVLGLRNVYDATGTHRTLPSVTGRSEYAVKRMYWGTIRGYQNQKGYLPGPGRTDRSGTPFTLRDVIVLRTGYFPEARKNSTAGHYAGILCRGVQEVVVWLENESLRFPEVPPVKGEDRWHAALRRITSGNWPRVNYDFALRVPER